MMFRMRSLQYIFVLASVFFLSACAETELLSHYAKKWAWPKEERARTGSYKVGEAYRVGSVWYYPQEDFKLIETGIASWYGPDFHGKRTANGEIYNQNELTAAHRTLQMPSLVKVTNLENGKSVVVRINDRGPFKRGRVIDVSKRAAELLGFIGQGTAKVRIEVLDKESRQIAAAAKRGMDTSRMTAAPVKGLPTTTETFTATADAPVSVPVPRKEVRVASLQTDADSLPESLRTPTITVEDLGPPPQPRQQQKPAPKAVERYAPPSPPRKQATMPAPAPPKQKTVVRGHLHNDGRFMPNPVVVSQAPVKATGIFVQAGSFAIYDNAERLRQRLSSIAPVIVDPIKTAQGRTLYRVRLGPIASVQEADTVLARVIETGQDTARIVKN